jgi:hypothetical protein
MTEEEFFFDRVLMREVPPEKSVVQGVTHGTCIALITGADAG